MITLAIPLVVPFIINLLLERTKAEKLNRLQSTATILVKDAEQTQATSETKKTVTQSSLQARFPGVDPHLVSSSIEAAIHDMKRANGPTTNINAGQDVVTVNPGPPAVVTIEPKEPV